MGFINRLGYYLAGFSVGLIILVFVLSKKGVSCSYGPNARVLKNLQSKQLVYSEKVKTLIDNNIIDTTDINQILAKGDVNFSKSNPRLTPCASYHIEGYTTKGKKINLNIKNCDSIAVVEAITEDN